MRKISFADISIFIVNYIFNWRFRIAKLTKQSKIIRKIIDKGLFEDDDVTVIPNTIKINKTIEAEKSEFIPTDILKEVIEKIDDIVIMNSCLCRTSNNCKDYPQDIGCIFLGPTSRKIPQNQNSPRTAATGAKKAADSANSSNDSAYLQIYRCLFS